jgi:hypothetical protein
MEKSQTKKCPFCGFTALLITVGGSSYYECFYCEIKDIDKVQAKTYYESKETENTKK